MAAYSTGYTIPYTGNQAMIKHREQMKKETKIMKWHERTTNVQNNIKPPLHDATPELLAQARSIYGVRLRPLPPPMRMFDRIMKPQNFWDPYTTHDQYSRLMEFHTNAKMDDENREIPVMTNSEYGHRRNARPEPFKREHGRVMTHHNNLYRNNGVIIGRPLKFQN